MTAWLVKTPAQVLSPADPSPLRSRLLELGRQSTPIYRDLGEAVYTLLTHNQGFGR